MRINDQDYHRRLYALEEERLFAESMLWRLQRDYYDEAGPAAWQSGQVPSYATSSPALAGRFAALALALFRDWQAMNRPGGDRSAVEKLYICELGAGSGRFAYHFLKRLTELCQRFQMEDIPFTYVMTDFTESNLAFWKHHPQFASFLEAGLLDMALFDMCRSDRLLLRTSGRELTAGSLQAPLVTIANYAFDSIPQELYYLEQGRWHECWASLYTDRPPAELEPGELLSAVEVRYKRRPVAAPAFAAERWGGLAEEYAQTLSDAHLLFPAAGLRCLERLQALSQTGLLLLAADKGEHEARLQAYKPSAGLVRHGSFSLPVNFHAFRRFCELQGGRALFPGYAHSGIAVGCLLLLDGPEQYVETIAAYGNEIADFGPDDFYTVAKQARKQASGMELKELMAHLRLNLFDAHQFSFYLPRLLELAPEFTERERAEVSAAAERVWESYFTLGEEADLAYQLAALHYEMGCYTEAVAYFQRSIDRYGEHSGTLYNMALCHFLLEAYEPAALLLEKAVAHDPHNAEAGQLLKDVASRIDDEC